MPTTPIFGLKYPAPSDPANGAVAFKELADTADTAFGSIVGTSVPASAARGLISISRQTSPTAYVSAVTPILQKTFIAEVGRRYRTTATGVFETNSGGKSRVVAYIHGAWGVGNPTDLRATAGFDIPTSGFAVTGNIQDYESITAGSGGAFTIKLSFIRGYDYGSGMGLIRARDFSLVIEDIGAAS